MTIEEVKWNYTIFKNFRFSALDFGRGNKHILTYGHPLCYETNKGILKYVKFSDFCINDWIQIKVIILFVEHVHATNQLPKGFGFFLKVL